MCREGVFVNIHSVYNKKDVNFMLCLYTLEMEYDIEYR